MTKRCAIYTRKSTEEGLEQSFNSLDAQREACEAFIASQKSERWRLHKARYDDGGYSGGSMDRPALQALLRDVEAGLIDIIVVYKVDRLTRSLADFAKLVEKLDARGASFVSVTQAFNTSTSMGRLTLNVLLSFAQFEREVTAERIKDKIAASRKKDLWTGGPPPLGYDNVDKSLVVNEAEAAIVTEIYRLYLETGCVRAIIRIAAEKGWVTKERANGKGGLPLTRGPIYHILQNPIYAGLLRSGGDLHEGQHQGIIARKDWEAVQDKRNSGRQWSGPVKSTTSLLAGKLFVDGERLTPSHASKSGRRYRYYISRANKDADGQRVRLKAGDVETAVISAVGKWLGNPQEAASQILKEGVQAMVIQEAGRRLERLRAEIDDVGPTQSLAAWVSRIERIDLEPAGIKITLCPGQLFQEDALPSMLEDKATIEAPLQLKKRGHELRLILGACAAPQPPDATVLSLLARARRWKRDWFAGERDLKDILIAEGVTPTSSTRTLRLAFLAPDIVEAFLAGTAPVELNAEKLKRLSDLPPLWEEQRKVLGMGQGTAT